MFTTAIQTAVLVTTLSLQALVPGTTRESVIGERSFSLENRQFDRGANEVFKDNILLNIAYMDGRIHEDVNINWDEIRKPFKSEFTLEKGETFAFHDDVLPEFAGKINKTTNAHFGVNEGFKAVWGLPGNGVCHLASIINWTAKDAGLNIKAPTNHDFAVINEVPREQGVAIYSNGKSAAQANSESGGTSAASLQNLYITNNTENVVKFKFHYDGTNLKVTVVKVN